MQQQEKLEEEENMPEQEWKQTKMLLPFPVVEADSVVVQPDDDLMQRLRKTAYEK